MVRAKIQVTEAVGTTIPMFASNVHVEPGGTLTTAEASSMTPLFERRCCALIDHGIHCGMPCHMPWKSKKCLCKEHLLELMKLEHDKSRMSSRHEELITRLPRALDPCDDRARLTVGLRMWMTRIAHIHFWLMFYRQHIVICFFPPGTYGAAYTWGHLNAIDFLDKRMREVINRVDERVRLLLEEHPITSSSRFSALAIDDCEDEECTMNDEDEDEAWDVTGREVFELSTKMEAIKRLRENDEALMQRMRETFYIHSDDIAHHAAHIWDAGEVGRVHEDATDRELLLPLRRDVDNFSDLARWLYLHSGAFGWINSIVLSTGSLHRFNTPENLKRILDSLLDRCLPMKGIHKVSVELRKSMATRKKGDMTIVNVVNMLLHPNNGYMMVACSPSTMNLESGGFTINHLLSPAAVEIFAKQGRNISYDQSIAVYTPLELDKEPPSVIMLDANADILMNTEDHDKTCAMIVGPRCIVLSMFAYHCLDRAFLRLTPSTVYAARVDLDGDDLALEAHLREHLPNSPWYLFCASTAASSAAGSLGGDVCCVLVETPKLFLVISCMWNPYKTSSTTPRSQNEFRIHSSISFEFGATMIRDMRDGVARRHVIDRIMGDIDLQTRVYASAQGIGCKGCMGPMLFFNKDTHGRSLARNMFDCLRGKHDGYHPTYFASGDGVELTTTPPPLRNITEYPDASTYDLVSQTSHIVYTRLLLPASSTSTPESLWTSASLCLKNKREDKMDPNFVPRCYDVASERKHVERHMGPNDRKQRYDRIIRETLHRRRGQI